MTGSPSTASAASPRWWDVRTRISPATRARLRHVVDPAFRPIASIRDVSTTDSTLTLTFDDGPDSQVTPGVLQQLDAYGATATFFVLVDAAARNPGLTREIRAAGHDVALHGLDHQRLTELDFRHATDHVREGRERLEDLLSSAVSWIRPPYGAMSPVTALAVRRAGLRPVVWGPVGYDWTDRTEDEVAASVMSSAEPGSIVLLHDGLWLPEGEQRPATDRAHSAGLVLRDCRARGLQCVSLSRALDRGRVVRSAWFRS